MPATELSSCCLVIEFKLVVLTFNEGFGVTGNFGSRSGFRIPSLNDVDEFSLPFIGFSLETKDEKLSRIHN
jgi:hypothetical protein